MKLTLIIATRGRPDLLKYTLEHTLLNVSRDDTRVLVCVDDDDAATLEGIKRLPQDDRMTISVKPREDSRGAKYDRALTEAKADVYVAGVDCAPILTPAFDQIFINAARRVPDGIACLHTPMTNGFFPPALQAVTSGLAAKLGGIYNHDYPYWFIDHELDDIARMIDRYFCVDVDVSTAPTRPAQTIRLRDLATWTTYYDWMTLERRLRARAIIDSPEFEEPEWRKAILRSALQYRPIEDRSKIINASVRATAAAIEAQRGDSGPADMGYVRAAARAAQKLLALKDDPAAQKAATYRNTAHTVPGVQQPVAPQPEAQPEAQPLIWRRDVDVHGVRQDWLWPAQDHWGWQHPLDTWPAIKALLPLCKQRRMVLQAGGCCGMYPALLAREFDQVFTVEMDPLNYKCLRQNVPDNKVITFHAALGNRRGQVSIDYRSAQNCGNHHVRETPGAVRMVRVDDLKLDVCDAILLDAEAYETEIIKGAVATITRCRPELIVAETISEEMIALLAGLGYELRPQTAADRHFVRRADSAAQLDAA